MYAHRTLIDREWEREREMENLCAHCCIIPFDCVHSSSSSTWFDVINSEDSHHYFNKMCAKAYDGECQNTENNFHVYSSGVLPHSYARSLVRSISFVGAPRSSADGK